MLLPAKEGSYRNFPSLRPENSAGHDFAALLQAYVELTQILSSAHVSGLMAPSLSSTDGHSGYFIRY